VTGYAEHLPAPALGNHVACYWSIHGEEHRAYRVLPDGCMDLVFDLAEGAGQVVGIMTTAKVVAARRRIAFFGVRFRPGEATAFVRCSAREVRDADVSLAEMFGRLGATLAERLAEAPSDLGRVRIVEAWLLEKKLGARFAEPRVRAAVRAIEASRGAVTVKRLAEQAGIGERQLERAFDERVGVGPKALARAIRLQAFVAALETRGTAPIASVAAEAGFADEPHLCREVRALTGLTPRELYLERTSDQRMSDSFKSTG
jgi:AraC-like DNA-binding protein